MSLIKQGLAFFGPQLAPPPLAHGSLLDARGLAGLARGAVDGPLSWAGLAGLARSGFMNALLSKPGLAGLALVAALV